MARLRIMSGPSAGQTVDVKGELVIGREDTDLEIADTELSRRHALVRPVANRLQVEDLGSSNGTFVDGSRIEEPTMLGGGAEIRVGTTVLVVEGVLPVSSKDGEAQIADPKATRITETPPELRQARAGSAEPAPPASPGTPPPASPGTPSLASPGVPSPPDAAVGVFRPPERRRQRGLASRSWIPVALSFGTVLLVAIALVIYFSQHT